MAFTGMDYFNANPDVWNAYQSNDFTANPTTANAFAQKHYNDYGQTEGRLWGSASTGGLGTDIVPNTIAPNVNQTTMFGDDISGLGVGSYSGLPTEYQNQLNSNLIPQLLDAVSNYRSDIDASTGAAADLFGNMSQNAVKQGLKGIMQDLENRNMMDSDVAGDVIGNASSNLIGQQMNNVYQSALSGSAMKANESGLIGQLLGLGQSSESFNQLAPYQLLSNFYLGAM